MNYNTNYNTGRKPMSERMRSVPLCMSAADEQRLIELGNGNKSAGVRKLLAGGSADSGTPTYSGPAFEGAAAERANASLTALQAVIGYLMQPAPAREGLDDDAITALILKHAALAGWPITAEEIDVGAFAEGMLP